MLNRKESNRPKKIRRMKLNEKNEYDVLSSSKKIIFNLLDRQCFENLQSL